MMSELAALELDSSLLSKLRSSSLRRITPETLLSYSIGDLKHAAQLTHDEADLLLSKAAKLQLTLAPASARAIWNGECAEWLGVTQFLSTGDESFDVFLHGGIPLRGLVEVCGESSSGKTQICLQLCLSAQLRDEGDGGHCSVLYVSTEDVFPHKRLAQLAEHFARRHGNSKQSWMDNVYIEHTLSFEDLAKLVEERLLGLLTSRRVRLVILDSVAAISRAEFALGEEAQRAQSLCGLAQKLRLLSVKHSVAIVIVNQVSAVMDGAYNAVQPALGLAWSDMITTRLLVSRLTPKLAVSLDPEQVCRQAPTVVRQVQVLFSPYLPTEVFQFVVEEQGLQAFRDTSP